MFVIDMMVSEDIIMGTNRQPQGFRRIFHGFEGLRNQHWDLIGIEATKTGPPLHPLVI